MSVNTIEDITSNDISWMSVKDDVTDRWLLIIQHPYLKKAIVVEDGNLTEERPSSLRKILRTWMKSVKEIDPKDIWIE